jgi:hypothetical protein
MAIVLLCNLSCCHSGVVFLPRATEALLEKVNSYIKMPYVKTDHREVIDCLSKYNLTCVFYLSIMILQYQMTLLCTQNPLLHLSFCINFIVV